MIVLNKKKSYSHQKQQSILTTTTIISRPTSCETHARKARRIVTQGTWWKYLSNYNKCFVEDVCGLPTFLINNQKPVNVWGVIACKYFSERNNIPCMLLKISDQLHGNIRQRQQVFVTYNTPYFQHPSTVWGSTCRFDSFTWPNLWYIDIMANVKKKSQKGREKEKALIMTKNSTLHLINYDYQKGWRKVLNKFASPSTRQPVWKCIGDNLDP